MSSIARRAAGPLAVMLLAAGCGQVVTGQPSPTPPDIADQPLIESYFERNNAAAEQGVAAFQEFLASTQHPDVADRCDLGDVTIRIDPSLSTLRPDDGWRPAKDSAVPRGRVYVIAVTITVQRNRTTLGSQIGSMHLAVLNGSVYGFAPCPT